MKTLSLILAPLFTLSAFAASPVTPFSLSKTSNNGTVAPQYSHTTTCTIQGSFVLIMTTGPLVHPLPLQRAISFNSDVPNETVMESLAIEASRASSKNFPGPIGGGVVSYHANLNSNPVLLKQTSGGCVTVSNDSEAATKLEQFIDANCN